MKSARQNDLFSYAVILAMVIGAGGLSYMIPELQQSPSPLFTAIVMLSAWWGGLRSAAFATLFSVVVWQIVLKMQGGNIDIGDFLEIGVFLLTATVVTRLVDRTRKQQRELDYYNKDLEKLVAERTEDLKANAKFWESFCYSIAHNLRAPLRAMHGFGQILLDEYTGKLDHQGQDYVKRIATSAAHMDEMICNLLAYGELQQKQFTLDLIDLQQQVALALKHLENQIRQCRADIVIKGEFPQVRGHPALLKLVLLNLLSNALKFVEPGSHPVIHIEALVQEESVLLAIQDHGIGIDPRFHERIFQPFHTLNDGTKYAGSGMGLATVRKAVEKMGATIALESKPGQGCRFSIKFRKAG